MKNITICSDFSNGSYRFSNDADGTVLPDTHELSGYSFPSRRDAKIFAQQKGYTID